MCPPWPQVLWNRRLAKLIYDIKFWQRYVAGVPERRAELEEMGFLWNRLQPEYNLVLEALVVFREEHGHLSVPANFLVPRQAPWPKSCWGMKLGSRVSSIRARNDHLRLHPERWFQLDAMGFSFAPSEYSWTRFIAALTHFKQLNGHLMVPASYLVEFGDPAWPESLFGMELGATVSNVRAKGTFLKNQPDRRQELLDLGFVFNVGDFRFRTIIEALEVFHSLHGHVKVPQKFCVPAADPWPENTRGMPLGKRVTMIRARGDLIKNSPERCRRLEQLGFVWHMGGGRRKNSESFDSPKKFELLLEALAVYKSEHGNCDVPVKWVVPERAPYPKDTWKIRLGARLSMIRSRGDLVRNSAERRAMLDEMGFRWKLPKGRRPGSPNKNGKKNASAETTAAMVTVTAVQRGS